MQHIYSIVKIIENMLNFVDPRLIDHGKRVAYVMYNVLRADNTCLDRELHRLCLLGLLHDVGAYKTEEIDDMVHFETDSVWQHSVYGYLLLKYFSPISELAPAILFHHANCMELTHCDPAFKNIAQLVNIADRLDILCQTKAAGFDNPGAYFERHTNRKFDAQVVAMFAKAGWEHLAGLLESKSYDPEFEKFLYGSPLTDDEISSLVRMLVLSIDFRSPQTVTHTFTSACVSGALARIFGLDEREQLSIFNGALLHDLGKIGIPNPILEKAGRLDDDEMLIMKTHVSLTKEILAGNVDPEIVELAYRHHERLDGSGYPQGLCKEDVTLGQRIIAVSDVLSALCTERSYKAAFPREQVIRILEDMSAKGFLDGDIVEASIRHYDTLMAEIENNARPIIRSYEHLQAESMELLDMVTRFNDTPGTDEISA